MQLQNRLIGGVEISENLFIRVMMDSNGGEKALSVARKATMKERTRTTRLALPLALAYISVE
jgi:hypothetical protein